MKNLFFKVTNIKNLLKRIKRNGNINAWTKKNCGLCL